RAAEDQGGGGELRGAGGRTLPDRAGRVHQGAPVGQREVGPRGEGVGCERGLTGRGRAALRFVPISAARDRQAARRASRLAAAPPCLLFSKLGTGRQRNRPSRSIHKQEIGGTDETYLVG